MSHRRDGWSPCHLKEIFPATITSCLLIRDQILHPKSLKNVPWFENPSWMDLYCWFIQVFVCICLHMHSSLNAIAVECASFSLRQVLTWHDIFIFFWLLLMLCIWHWGKKSPASALCACVWGARSLRCLPRFYFYLSSLCTMCQNKHTGLWNARSVLVGVKHERVSRITSCI